MMFGITVKGPLKACWNEPNNWVSEKIKVNLSFVYNNLLHPCPPRTYINFIQMKLPAARSFMLSWIKKLRLLKNGCWLLGVFGSGRQGVKKLVPYVALKITAGQWTMGGQNGILIMIGQKLHYLVMSTSIFSSQIYQYIIKRNVYEKYK